MSSSLAATNQFGNGDFETGDISSWSVTGGTWTGIPVAPLDPTSFTASGGVATIIPNGTIDPNIINYNTITGSNIGTSINGNYSLKINNAVNDQGVTVVTQTATNYQYNLISISWLGILQDSHEVGNSDHIVIEVKNLNTNVVVGSVSYSSASTPTYFTDIGNVYVSGWQTLNVNVSLGYDYAISILAADCPFGGHWGYLYVDFIGHNNPLNTPVTPIGIPNIVPAGNLVGGAGINLVSTQINGQSVNYRNIFEGGTLTIDTNNQSYSGNFGLSSGGAIIDQNGNSVVFSGVFSDYGENPGGVQIINSQHGGEVKLSGVSTFSGDVSIASDASLTVTGAGKLGNGNYDGNITVMGSLKYEAEGSQYINGIIEGDGNIQKSGDGKLILNANNNFNGVTTISGGSLVIGASSGEALAKIDGAVNIVSGGTLAGYGTAGGYDQKVTNSGIVSPGNDSIGTLKIGGKYQQTLSGNLNVDISPDLNDKLVVSQRAEIDGALNIYALSGTYKPTRYTLITSSLLEGKFDRITTNIKERTSLNYFFTQDKENFYLTLGPDYINTRLQINNNLNYLKSLFDKLSNNNRLVLNFDCNVFSYQNSCVSIIGEYAALNKDIYGNSNHQDYGTTSIVYSYRSSPYLRIGGWIEKDISLHQSSPFTLGTNPALGSFAVYSPEGTNYGFQLNTSIAYYKNSVGITRQPYVNAEPGNGSTRIKSIGAQIKLGYGIPNSVNGSILTPYIGIRAIKNSVPAYSETTTSEVQSPISYSSYNSHYTQIFGGFKAEGLIYQNLSYLISFDFQKDIRGDYSSFVAHSDIYNLSEYVVPSSALLHSKVGMSGKLTYQLGTHEYISLSGSLIHGLNNAAHLFSVGVNYVLGF